MVIAGTPSATYVAPTHDGRVRKFAVVGAVVAGILIAGASTVMLRHPRGESQRPGALQAQGGKSTLVDFQAKGSMPELGVNVSGQSRPSNNLAAVATAPGTNLQAEGQMPDGPVQVNAALTSAPTMQVVAQNDPSPSLQIPVEAVGMPDDVRKWLEHLERCEKERLALAASQLTASFGTMAHMQADDAASGLDPDKDDSQDIATQRVNQRADGYANSTDGLRQAWIQLTSKFNSVQPPAECVSIRNSYDEVLNGTGSMMLDIISTVRSASQNREGALAKLMAMQGKSSDKIDRPARDTDGGVSSVCRKYETKKWFDIKSDIGGGIMSSLGM